MEFRGIRGNGLPGELNSQLVRYSAVTHMKNACTPGFGDVKIDLPRSVLAAAAAAL
jgi:hypothetical protein